MLSYLKEFAAYCETCWLEDGKKIRRMKRRRRRRRRTRRRR